MNKWFDKIEYAQSLLDADHLEYSNADISMIAGFLICQQGLSVNEASSIIMDRLMKVYDLAVISLRKKKWLEIIKHAAKRGYDDIAPLKIYKSEVDEIHKAKTITQRRLLFTLLCFAKYQNATSGESSDWVSFPDPMIKKAAGVRNMSTAELNKVLYDLKEAGFVTHSKKVTSNNIHVNFCSTKEDDEEVYTISDLRGLGDIYMALLDTDSPKAYTGKLKVCKNCGAAFLDRTTKSNRMYCSNCQSGKRSKEK